MLVFIFIFGPNLGVGIVLVCGHNYAALSESADIDCSMF